ncbi:N-acetyltransferase family protein KNAG_0A02970 [Huiozyma naganishii CBS 8797]|uniref:N-acetyltransferase domain-containing protein n=1 Tax=Huiozyma naganishii (strain ATCC MYA-139 / BCRC 22969 / CBS 8797 / KCTC 17520 / NBRC 10181 / NCYC 3082 / Yp74L-3) TaxID=1071383 RepID=J7QZS4_HUIN7|nr:hypothetical protein KNAG_0A02970 [Kazachstania naganishii CBS 8797]CCK67985.1 hypothetical protein KNAG_0A02970 [Kazachstania naganishii CBS 8797]
MTRQDIWSTKLLHDGPTFNKPLVERCEPVSFKLSDGTVATAFAIFDSTLLASALTALMHRQFNMEIEAGDTYPQSAPLTRDEFIDYWHHSMCVVLLHTDQLSLEAVNASNPDWEQLFLGTFYIKPNYMSRCSHICNAGFLVNPTHRGKRIGYRLAQVYLKWAPLLGYTYSVFNLVFVTNIASWKIWDRFKFDRIGLIPRAGQLAGHKEPVDAIVFGKNLTNVEEELFADFETL